MPTMHVWDLASDAFYNFRAEEADRTEIDPQYDDDEQTAMAWTCYEDAGGEDAEENDVCETEDGETAGRDTAEMEGLCSEGSPSYGNGRWMADDDTGAKQMACSNNGSGDQSGSSKECQRTSGL